MKMTLNVKSILQVFRKCPTKELWTLNQFAIYGTEAFVKTKQLEKNSDKMLKYQFIVLKMETQRLKTKVNPSSSKEELRKTG